MKITINSASSYYSIIVLVNVIDFLLLILSLLDDRARTFSSALSRERVSRFEYILVLCAQAIVHHSKTSLSGTMHSTRISKYCMVETVLIIYARGSVRKRGISKSSLTGKEALFRAPTLLQLHCRELPKKSPKEKRA